MAGIEDCINSARDQGAISQEEANRLKARIRELEGRERVADAKAEAKAELANELRAEAKERKRIEDLATRAAQAIERDTKELALRNNKADMAGAFYRMFENFGDAGYSSVRGIYNALLGNAHSEMADLLHTFRRSAISLRRFNRPLLEDITKAAFGEKTTPEAEALYKAWLSPAERLRNKFNELGGAIGWRDDWGIPMRHNGNALMKAGLEKWQAYIRDRLDWDKMESPLTGEKIPEGQRDAVLEHVWHSIVMDGWNTREPSRSHAGKPALYNQRQDPRFLVFKDSGSWLDYNRAYGTGDVFNTMTAHLRSMAKDVALMQRLGPNPRATIEWMKQNLTKEAQNIRAGRPSLLNSGQQMANFRAFRAASTLDALYDIAKGSGVPFSFLGNGMGMLRNVTYAAKLGSSVITHTFSNTVIQAMGRYLHGLPITKIPLDMARAFTNKHELTQAGVIAQDAMHTLEGGAREQGAWMKLRELSNWLPTWTTHYSGLEGIVNANRRAFAGSMMATLANHVAAPFEEMPQRLQNMLSGYGIGSKEWEVIRQAELHEPERGATFLRAREIADVKADNAEALSLKYLEMLSMATEVAVPSANWRGRAQLMAGTKEGTLVGEAVRSAMMFKSGFMATFMLTQRDMLARELARNPGSAAAYIGASIIGLGIAGLMTLQAKQITNGKDLRPMDPSTEQGRDTWYHAFLTSGALGIYGDFIASDRSSYGHDMLSTVAGPVVTEAEDVYHAGRSLVVGQKNKSRDELAEGMVPKFFRNNTPVLSTHWALRAAYNRMLLDQLQYVADPHAHEAMRKTQDRVLSDTNQRYWWRPGQVTPDRLPQATTARH
jgi:hypothetical protein